MAATKVAAVSSDEAEAMEDVLPLPLKPQFQPLSANEIGGGRIQFRKVIVPNHRYTPLKQHWLEIYTPIYEQMKIDVRMNLKVSIDPSFLSHVYSLFLPFTHPFRLSSLSMFCPFNSS